MSTGRARKRRRVEAKKKAVAKSAVAQVIDQVFLVGKIESFLPGAEIMIMRRVSRVFAVAFTQKQVQETMRLSPIPARWLLWLLTWVINPPVKLVGWEHDNSSRRFPFKTACQRCHEHKVYEMRANVLNAFDASCCGRIVCGDCAVSCILCHREDSRAIKCRSHVGTCTNAECELFKEDLCDEHRDVCAGCDIDLCLRCADFCDYCTRKHNNDF